MTHEADVEFGFYRQYYVLRAVEAVGSMFSAWFSCLRYGVMPSVSRSCRGFRVYVSGFHAVDSMFLG